VIEGVCRRQLALVEGDDVFARPAERLASGIYEGGRINRVLWQIGAAETAQCDHRALPVGSPVGADVFGRQVPAVDEPADLAHARRHLVERVLRGVVDGGGNRGRESRRIEWLSWRQAELAQAEQAIVVLMRRIFGHQGRETRQHGHAIHVVDLLLRRRPVVYRRIGRQVPAGGLYFFPQ